MADIILSKIEFLWLLGEYENKESMDKPETTEKHFREFRNNWQYVAFENAYIELRKGFVVDRFILKHLPSSKYYETTAVYTSDEGYVNSDNDVLILNEVFPEEYTATRFVKKLLQS